MVVGRVGIEHLALCQATGKKVSKRSLPGRRHQRDRLPESNVEQRHVHRRSDRPAGAQIPRFFRLRRYFQPLRPAASSLGLHGIVSAQPRFLFILRCQQKYSLTPTLIGQKISFS